MSSKIQPDGPDLEALRLETTALATPQQSADFVYEDDELAFEVFPGLKGSWKLMSREADAAGIKLSEAVAHPAAIFRTPKMLRKIGEHEKERWSRELKELDMDVELYQEIVGRLAPICCYRLPAPRINSLRASLPNSLKWVADLVPKKIHRFYKSRLSVALQYFVVLRFNTVYDIVTDLVLVERLSRTSDQWWFYISLSIIIVPIVLKSILSCVIFVDKLERSRDCGGFGLHRCVAVACYLISIAPIVFLADFYLLLVHPFAPPEDVELLGTLDRLSPLLESVEQFCQTLFVTYMTFRSQALGRKDTEINVAEMLFFAWLPAFIGFCGKVPQLMGDAALVGLPLHAYIRELVLCPLGLSVPLFHLMSTRYKVSFCNLGSMRIHQDKIFDSVVEGSYKIRKLYRLEFDKGNQIDRTRMARKLNNFKPFCGRFTVKLHEELTPEDKEELFKHLLANPFIQIILNGDVYQAYDEVSKKKPVNFDEIWNARKRQLIDNRSKQNELEKQRSDLSRSAMSTVTVQELSAAGVSARLCSNAGFSLAEMKAAGFPARDLINVGFIDAKEYRKLGFSASELREAGFLTTELMMAGIKSAENLVKAGYTAAELKRAQFSARSLIAAGIQSAHALKLAGFSAEELRNEGFSAPGLQKAGYDLANLAAAGFTVGQLKRAGFSSTELVSAGFVEAKDLLRIGFDEEDLRDAGFEHSDELRELPDSELHKLLRFPPEGLRCRGFSAARLRQAGFSAMQLKGGDFTLKELLNVGFTLQELKRGFSIEELMEAGICEETLTRAGFTSRELGEHALLPASLPVEEMSALQMRDLGYSASVIWDAGYSVLELKKAGFTCCRNLRNEGIPAGMLLIADFSMEEVLTAGYSARDLRSADIPASTLLDHGFSARSLRTGGYSASDLKSAGKNPLELKDAGYSLEDLKNAGFSLEEMKQADFPVQRLSASGFTAENLEAAGFSHALVGFQLQSQEKTEGTCESMGQGFTFRASSDELDEAASSANSET